MTRLNGIVILLLLCAGATTVDSRAAESIRLAVAGKVESELAERARVWAEANLAIPVPSAPAIPAASGSLDDVAATAAKSLPEAVPGIIVLYGDGDENGNHGIYRKDLRVVVVNVAAMRKGADPETFARRIDRQVIRGIAALMGIDWSPDPFSATAFYDTMEELDRIGLNMDPPSLLLLQRKAVELGIPLDPDNLFNMMK